MQNKQDRDILPHAALPGVYGMGTLPALLQAYPTPAHPKPAPTHHYTPCIPLPLPSPSLLPDKDSTYPATIFHPPPAAITVCPTSWLCLPACLPTILLYHIIPLLFLAAASAAFLGQVLVGMVGACVAWHHYPTFPTTALQAPTPFPAPTLLPGSVCCCLCTVLLTTCLPCTTLRLLCNFPLLV